MKSVCTLNARDELYSGIVVLVSKAFNHIITTLLTSSINQTVATQIGAQLCKMS